MFNKSGYNRGKFNRVSDAASDDIFTELFIGVSVIAAISRIRRSEADADMSLAANAKPTLVRPIKDLGVVFSLGAIARAIKKTSAKPEIAAVNLEVQATYYAYGTEEMSFPGLALRPGDELVIDTDLMTVTLNGVNIVHYASMDSKFIQLLAGSNTLVWQDASGASRQASVRVEWKPRWL
jgi:hypothetical protein